jgi:hypothetical protein
MTKELLLENNRLKDAFIELRDFKGHSSMGNWAYEAEDILENLDKVLESVSDLLENEE